jgi:hypothetical protein
MHVSDAVVHSRARENSPGMRVRGVEQGVRFFFPFFFPQFSFRIPHPADDRASVWSFFFLPLFGFSFSNS